MAGLSFAVVIGLALGLAVWNQATREDKPENYAFLCERLLDDVPVIGAPTIKPSQAEVEVGLQNLKAQLKHLSRRCRELSPIAEGFSDLIGRVEELARNAPQGSKIVFGLAEAILGAYSGQREHVGTGGQKALQETERGWNAIKEVENIFHQKHILAVKLAELAPQFSGPMTNQPFVTCSFAEHTPGFFEIEKRDFLSLVNSSGRDLHNCVIAVRLSNAKGESFVNLHFAQSWQKNEKRVAQYSDTDFPKTAVEDVIRVDVSVWAAELSTEPVTLKPPTFGWPEPK